MYRINISTWATALLPLPWPNINPNLLLIYCDHDHDHDHDHSLNMSTGKKVMRIDEPISCLKITSSYLDQVFDRRREQWSLLNQYCVCQG